MTLITQAEAGKMKCPVARTFDEGKSPTCDGGGCILWRWAPMPAADPRFMRAVAAKQMELHAAAEAANNEKKRLLSSFHNAAVAAVAADPNSFMKMTDSDRGWCGLGGKP